MKTVYIVCEGAKCEPAYFEKFQKLYATELCINQIQIVIKPVGNHQIARVHKQINHLKKNQRGGMYYACFDIDRKKDTDLQKALSYAKNPRNSEMADRYLISQRQFEVWLQWHFSNDIPWNTNSGNPNEDKPTNKQKGDLNNKIKDLTKDDIQSAIDRAKSNKICEGRCFSTCYIIEDLISNTQHSI